MIFQKFFKVYISLWIRNLGIVYTIKATLEVDKAKVKKIAWDFIYEESNHKKSYFKLLNLDYM